MRRNNKTNRYNSKNTQTKAFAKSLILFALLCVPAVSFAEEVQNAQNAFNLTTVMDNFLNLEPETKNVYDTLDEKTRQRQEFADTSRKFNQGNVSVAYNDFASIISELDNDLALFVTATTMYDIGFFTLGDVAISKIKNHGYFDEQITLLKKSNKALYPLDKQEEIFLAKAYTSILYDNTPEETAFDLSKKTSLLKKSDYANYIMSQALLESRQYQQALMYIDTAIEKNPKSLKYASFKVEVLTRAKKYKEALKYLQEQELKISPDFKMTFLNHKENILAGLSNDENEKKFYQISVIYNDGNYYKVINECRNILNFNKNNYKILTLQAKSFLNTGNIELAEKGFTASYDINKKYLPTLIGLADTYYIKKDFVHAEEFYKKALKIKKSDPETLLKLSILYNQTADLQSVKKLAKLKKETDKVLKNSFYEYYLVATTIFKDNPNLRRDYLMKALVINPTFKPAISEYFAYLNDTDKQTGLQNFLYFVSFSNNLSYSYYYFRGIVEKNLGNKQDALANLRRCLVLNPDYEPAFRLLNDINSSLSLSLLGK